MSSSSDVYRFDIIIDKYIIYINNIIFAAGLIGNIFNILVFTKLKVFRGNRCAFYLIIESIVSTILLFIYFIFHIFKKIYGAEPDDISLIVCKLKITFIQSCRLLISSVICFKALDQFFSTNYRVYLRRIPTFKRARYSVIIATILWVLQTIPYIFFSNIVPSLGCIVTNQALFRYYSYFYYILLNGLFPILISSLFSLFAYQNVRHLIRRQVPIQRRRLDHQMTAMIFVRVLVFVILTLPFTIFQIYKLNININLITDLHYDINQIVATIVTSLLIYNYSLTFYIFLVTSSRFRRQVKYLLLKKCWLPIKYYCCKSNRNAIHPMVTISDASGIELVS
ncbi:unnamed protein product [Adineta steineri]|uniref:G-protein coupled receptors family 1 profile domain-containing protein n=1 Tax=Adineta steineri TaxID=433720 RepID=A0A818K4Y5_9BILA|nr:unnamed protein product [Adineta steineri]